MENTKAIQYRLRNGQNVEVTINNDGVPGEKVSISDLAIEKTIMCHLGFTEEVSKNMVWLSGEQWILACANSLLLVPQG